MNSADVQDAVANEVNDRLSKAIQELASKYAKGNGGIEDSISQPTGSAYKELYAKQQKQLKVDKQQNQNDKLNKENKHKNNEFDDDEDDDNNKADNGDDDDYELRQIKEARMRQIRSQHQQKIENLGKGHGQYREITQDEFIQEITSSMIVICHFFHRDFQKCEIMNLHLSKLAQRHIESKFVRINAEKTPFFVEKLKVRTMPTVVIFNDGVAVDKIIGFEGMGDRMPEGQEDSFPTIFLARLLGSKKAINSSAIIDDDEIGATLKARMLDVRRQQFIGMQDILDDDDDFED